MKHNEEIFLLIENAKRRTQKHKPVQFHISHGTASGQQS